MKNSKIEWTDHTVNFWRGCTKISPGCTNCCAQRSSYRLGAKGGSWGAGLPRFNNIEKARKELLALNASAKRRGVIEKVFVNYFSDWLDDEVPIEWVAVLLDTIRICDSLIIQLLTKRPENWEKRIGAACSWMSPLGPYAKTKRWLYRWLGGWDRENHEPPANIWAGTTVENQEYADKRIPALLSIPAKIRFVSYEPAVGPVSLDRVEDDGVSYLDSLRGYIFSDGSNEPSSVAKLDWVICGGESGAKPRPMHPDWARSLRDQCKAAGVPFFFKQWGEWLPDTQRNFRTSGNITWGLVNKAGDFRLCLKNGKRDWNQDVTHFDGETGTTCVGKYAAGRLLNGVEHNEFPSAECYDIGAL